MALENLYFRHNFNARNDPKLIKIRRKLKLEGVAIYWYLIEFSYERNGYFNNEELENFAWQEQLEMDIVKQVLDLAGFKLNENNCYYLDGVIKRIEKREEFCQKQKDKANKRWSKTTEKRIVPVPVPDWYKEQENKYDNLEEKQKAKQEIENKADKKLGKNKVNRRLELLGKSINDTITKEEQKEFDVLEEERNGVLKELVK